MDSLDFHLHDIQLNQQLIVDSCSFSVKHRRITALIGPSGCGKTTMLNTIAGLLEFPHLEIPQNDKLAYIFQDARLIPWLSIGENLSLIDPNLNTRDIERLLEDVKLKDVADAYPIQLSGGMQRRVSIARAFVNKPKLVLLDEPFSSLDVPTAHYLQTLVKSLLHKNGASALLVTHNLQEALAMADDLYFLSLKPTLVIRHIANPLFNQQMGDSKPNIDQVKTLEHTILAQFPNILSGQK